MLESAGIRRNPSKIRLKSVGIRLEVWRIPSLPIMLVKVHSSLSDTEIVTP